MCIRDSVNLADHDAVQLITGKIEVIPQGPWTIGRFGRQGFTWVASPRKIKFTIYREKDPVADSTAFKIPIGEKFYTGYIFNSETSNLKVMPKHVIPSEKELAKLSAEEK